MHNSTQDKELPTTGVLTHHPMTILGMTQGLFKQRIEEALNKKPEIFNLSERELLDHMRRNDYPKPQAVDNRLRLKFWVEYDRAQAHIDKMVVERVCGGICSDTYFIGTYLAVPENVAYMLTMPIKYEVFIEEALNHGLNELREILDLPNFTPKGKVDVGVLGIKVKIVAMLDMRLKGGVVQRLEQKNLNLHVSGVANDAGQLLMENNIEKIEERLKEIRRLEARATNGGMVITVDNQVGEEPADDKDVIDVESS